MIIYTSKKISFLITALLCDLFTSICMAAVHIHTYKVGHIREIPPTRKKILYATLSMGGHHYFTLSQAIHIQCPMSLNIDVDCHGSLVSLMTWEPLSCCHQERVEEYQFASIWGTYTLHNTGSKLKESRVTDSSLLEVSALMSLVIDRV